MEMKIVPFLSFLKIYENTNIYIMSHLIIHVFVNTKCCYPPAVSKYDGCLYV